MGIRAWLKSSSSTGHPDNAGQPETDTDPQDLTPVDRGEQDSAEDDTTDYPYVFGSMRSAREHAEALRDGIIRAGLVDRTIWQGELERLHLEMCEDYAWLPRLWDAVGRELAKLPGVTRGTIKVNGQRLTAYEVRVPAEAAAVVELAEAERRRV
jgi:hypothetical protein